jgi:hypothetical protein
MVNLEDLWARWNGLGQRRRAATVVVVAVIIIAAIWILT